MEAKRLEYLEARAAVVSSGKTVAEMRAAVAALKAVQS